ncbi:hypothetical protein [Dinoroseobacter sp. S375]|uniref:hypothetical protein n=1 Tax=Dinoroseobacter sp. S375 TaxID=3415136 RepID=UPI003C7BCE59
MLELTESSGLFCSTPATIANAKPFPANQTSQTTTLFGRRARQTASLLALQEFNPSEAVTAFAGARHYAVDAEHINSAEHPSATNRDSHTLLWAGMV